MSDAFRISPSAFFTSYVWYRHGLSHRALQEQTGAASSRSMDVELRQVRPLQMMLLRRHLVIDHLLTGLVESVAVSQVLEIGAGMSARGMRFMQRYGEGALRYVEGDLPRGAAAAGPIRAG